MIRLSSMMLIRLRSLVLIRASSIVLIRLSSVVLIELSSVVMIRDLKIEALNSTTTWVSVGCPVGWWVWRC